MFCCTLAIRGILAATMLFAMELDRVVLGCKLNHHYSVTTLPDED
jgi:hypothetical protein